MPPEGGLRFPCLIAQQVSSCGPVSARTGWAHRSSRQSPHAWQSGWVVTIIRL